MLTWPAAPLAQEGAAPRIVRTDPAAFRQASAVPKLPLRLAPAADGKATMHLPEARLERPATIWLAIYDREERTPVKRGENAGRELSEYNIVRRLRQLASWDGRAKALEIDLSEAAAQGMGGAILIQSADYGPIIGALDLPAATPRASVE